MRRITSDSSPGSTTLTASPPAPPPLARKKEEPAGEWAEVLYDFIGDVSTHVLLRKKWLASSN